jgi:hypothetical protein
MARSDSEFGVSPETLELLDRALSALPVEDLRDFVALMETVGSLPSPVPSPYGMRRALAKRQRPRRPEWQPRKSPDRFG